MIDQLPLTGLRTPAPSITPEDVKLVVQVLREVGRWMTAADLVVHLGSRSGFSDRKVRAVAAAAMPQIVSYPGSPGYRLFQHCTIDEINHCIEAFESQGSDMLKRAVEYRRAYHKRFRGERA